LHPAGKGNSFIFISKPKLAAGVCSEHGIQYILRRKDKWYSAFVKICAFIPAVLYLQAANLALK
jgi:hypothetical protein